MTTMPDATTEAAARRYLRRWAVIGGVWLAATVLVVGWAATRDGPAITADDLTVRPLVPITITTEPAPPLYTLPTAPEPTRYPTTTTTTAAASTGTATDAQTGALVGVSNDFTSGSLTTCIGGQPPSTGHPDWWCAEAPTTCVGATTVWPSITDIGADMDLQWSRSYCLPDEDSRHLTEGCQATLRQYGGTSCVLYLTGADGDATNWKMAGIIDGCGGPDPVGTVISKRCTRSDPVG